VLVAEVVLLLVTLVYREGAAVEAAAAAMRAVLRHNRGVVRVVREMVRMAVVEAEAWEQQDLLGVEELVIAEAMEEQVKRIRLEPHRIHWRQVEVEVDINHWVEREEREEQVVVVMGVFWLIHLARMLLTTDRAEVVLRVEASAEMVEADSRVSS